MTSPALRLLWSRSGLRWRTVLVLAPVALVAAACWLSVPVLTSRLIDSAAGGRLDAATVAALAGVVVLGSACTSVQGYTLQLLAQGVVLSTRERVIDRLLRIEIHELDKQRVGDLVARVTDDTALIGRAISSTSFALVSALIVIGGSLTGMAVTDLPLFVAVVVATALATSVIVVSARSATAVAEEMQRQNGRLSASLERAVSGMRTIRSLGATSDEVRELQARARTAHDANLRIAKRQAVVGPAVVVIMQLCIFAVLAIGGIRVSTGGLTIAELVQFMLFLFFVVLPASQLAHSVVEIRVGWGGFLRIREVEGLERESATQEIDAHVPGTGHASTRSTRSPTPSVELRDLSFAYDAEDVVLDGVDLRLAQGERLALVGPSGAGKSTVLHLIQRFYTGYEGNLLIDGVEQRTWPPERLRQHVAMLEQSPSVLHGSLRSNLLLGVKDVPDDQLVAALVEVNLQALLERDGRGLDADVGEHGVLLSGGEQQRLAMARILLRRPRLLLLDEPTAGQDSHNDALVRQAVSRLIDQDCAMLVVAHRISTIQDFDRIAVLDRGRVIGVGTHRGLLRSCPVYGELARAQAVL